MSIDQNRELILRMVESQAVLEGRFSNIRRIGADGGPGNFSLMFTAADSVTGKQVALKVFHPARRDDAYRLASFRREAEMLGEFVGHPNIIQRVSSMADFSEGFDTPHNVRYTLTFSYFTMELATSDLATAVAFGGMDAEAKLVLFRDACKGFQRLHARQMVHRDPKPRNLLVMADRHVKIGDLGTLRSLAKNAVPLLPDYAGFWPGDLRYAAPEMLAGLFSEAPELAIHADFFGLGTILFELFTGQVLTLQVFDGSFAMDLTTAMAHVLPGKRRQIYDDFVTQLADGHPLPRMSLSEDSAPKCIQRRLEALYSELCHLDYRKRLHGFEALFRQIEICLIVLRNEQKYRRWLMEKRRRRAAFIGAGRLGQ
jgi:serine/threonine protein kinase